MRDREPRVPHSAHGVTESDMTQQLNNSNDKKGGKIKIFSDKKVKTLIESRYSTIGTS